MKKLLLSGLLVIATASAFAQGTVNFNNNGIQAGPGGVGNDPSRLVYFGTGTSTPLTLGSGNFVAQLWFGAAGANESSLTAVAGAPTAFRAATTSLPGTWASGGTKTLAGFAEGSAVSLQVRVWDLNKGADWAAAGGANGALFTGKSAIFSYSVPTAGSPPAAYLMSGFQGFSVAVPEPSTILLGVLGAGALLLRRRK